MKLFLAFIFLFHSFIASQTLWEQVIESEEYGNITTRVVLDPPAFNPYDKALAGTKVIAVDNVAYKKAVHSAKQPRVFDGNYVFTDNDGSVMYTDGLGDCVGIAVYFPGSVAAPGFSGIYHCTQMELFDSDHPKQFKDNFLAELFVRTENADKSQVQISLATTYLTDSVTEIVRLLQVAGFSITATSFSQIAIDRTQSPGTHIFLVKYPITSVGYQKVVTDLTTGIDINPATGEVLVSRIIRS
jgi:hypothetical protein